MPKMPQPTAISTNDTTAGQSRPELSGEKKYTKNATTLPLRTPIIHHNNAKKIASNAY